jgi:drug/metabolite transporter (DMT)-like permease
VQGVTPRSSTTSGLLIAVVAAFTFGTSGAVVKPLLDSGWSPAAAVTARALVGGILLAPVAAVTLRGRWRALWTSRLRILAMALIGVAGCQLAYFAAIERVPVGTAILLEYMAPILLVLVAWARTRRVPQRVVLVGSVVALGGLVLVVAPGGGSALDPLGLAFGVLAMIGCAVYYVVAAAPSDGLPPVALASVGLVVGGVALGVIGVTGLVPFTMSTDPVSLFGTIVPWWLPVAFVGLVSTAVAYTANITASELLGSRLASFAGLLEVVAATLYAWILLGQDLTWVKLAGGVLILAGIAFVRSERAAAPSAAAARLVGAPEWAEPDAVGPGVVR